MKNSTWIVEVQNPKKIFEIAETRILDHLKNNKII